MDKEKQIEEMARVINEYGRTYDDCVKGCEDHLARHLYNAGYRKALMCCECKFCEVVIDSIIDEPKWFCTRMVGCMPVDPTDYCSRAKMKGAE